MNEVLGVVASPWSSIGIALLLFGLAPPAVLRVMIRAYPRDHPRRAELVRELEEVPFHKRPMWVVSLIPACFDDGFGARAANPAVRAAGSLRGTHAWRLGIMVVGGSILVAVGTTTLALASEQGQQPVVVRAPQVSPLTSSPISSEQDFIPPNPPATAEFLAPPPPSLPAADSEGVSVLREMGKSVSLETSPSK